jgi:hypothetical protein
MPGEKAKRQSISDEIVLLIENGQSDVLKRNRRISGIYMRDRDDKYSRLGHNSEMSDVNTAIIMSLLGVGHKSRMISHQSSDESVVVFNQYD